MRSSLPIAVHGASGRMGRAILSEADAVGLRVVAALVGAGSPHIGKHAAGDASGAERVDYSATLAAGADPKVLIDFSVADAFDAALALALERRLPFVSGTTGIDAAQRTALASAARTIPVLWSANFSLGIAVLSRLVADAARALPDWDCEIVEAHHVSKRDAPSGTALALGREIAAARGQVFDAVAALDRNAGGERQPGSIGFATLRAGDIVGEHTIVFATAGERLEMSHRATDRAIFARGALAAARWLAARDPGLHTLADVVDSRR